MSLEAFERKFGEMGMAFTSQRRAIAKVVTTSENHPDIEEIYQKVREIDKRASIATVYRNINLFAAWGLIAKRDFKDGKSRYELIHERHNHIILQDGKIIEFQSVELEQMIQKIADEHKLELHDYVIELYCNKKTS
jgi:Fur family ferric uptake transcriptional regulator